MRTRAPEGLAVKDMCGCGQRFVKLSTAVDYWCSVCFQNARSDQKPREGGWVWGGPITGDCLPLWFNKVFLQTRDRQWLACFCPLSITSWAYPACPPYHKALELKPKLYMEQNPQSLHLTCPIYIIMTRLKHELPDVQTDIHDSTMNNRSEYASCNDKNLTNQSNQSTSCHFA
jgi:hypothetical protein